MIRETEITVQTNGHKFAKHLASESENSVQSRQYLPEHRPETPKLVKIHCENRNPPQDAPKSFVPIDRLVKLLNLTLVPLLRSPRRSSVFSCCESKTLHDRRRSYSGTKILLNLTLVPLLRSLRRSSVFSCCESKTLHDRRRSYSGTKILKNEGPIPDRTTVFPVP